MQGVAVRAFVLVAVQLYGTAASGAPSAVGGMSGPIAEIVVADNSKTTDDTVLYIADIEEGDDWDPDERERVRLSLISSGLFKEVDLAEEAHPKGGLKITIFARDKHSWIVAPTYYDQPTNRGFGVGFGENNLFGENKKLLLYGQLATGDSFFVGAYIDPSIGGTPFSWQLDVLMKKERVIEYEIPTRLRQQPDPVRQSKLNYMNTGIKVGVTILRRLQLDARLRGAWVSFDDEIDLLGARGTDVGVPDDATTYPAPGVDGWDVSTELIAKWDRRSNFYGISDGNKYQIAYESAQPALGSDFDYWYATVSFERARRFFETGNFILKSSFGYGEDLPFQQEYRSGGTSLRGYKNGQMRGDMKAAANAELSLQLFNIKGFAVRTLAFVDSTYTKFHDVDETDTYRNYLPDTGRGGLGPLKNSVGVGTRFYIRQIVLPLLGLDIGYGLEGGGTEIYLAIGLTDG